MDSRDISVKSDVFNFDEDNLDNIVEYIKNACDEFKEQVNERPVVWNTFKASIWPEGGGDLLFYIGVQLAP